MRRVVAGDVESPRLEACDLLGEEAEEVIGARGAERVCELDAPVAGSIATVPTLWDEVAAPGNTPLPSTSRHR
jgi:hypothetical protein